MGKNFLDSHNSSSTRRHVYIGMTLMLLLAVAAIIFAIVKDDSQESHLSHRIPYHLLKLGDVLLRNGNSLDSAVIRRLSHCTYSHIGIITQINKGGIQITHATIDEKMPDGSLKNEVITENIDDFFTQNIATGGLILRPIKFSQEKINDIIREIKSKEGAPFNLETREKPHLYCTTLLYDAMKKYDRSFSLEWISLSIPSFHGVYLMPCSFIKNQDYFTVISSF